MIADLERRAAGTTGDLERRIERFDAQKQAIAQALGEVARVTDLVSALGAHLAALTEPDQALARAEARVEQLQSRAAETTASLEERADETAANLERRAAKAITSLEERAAETTGDLERRIGGFEAHEHRIGHALAEATRVADLVAGLEARLATLTGPGQALAQAETTVERLQQRAFEAIATLEQRAIDATASLERRAADTTTDLERRLDTFEAQKQAIVRALGEATRVTDLVTALETHLASLTGPDQALARAEARVDQLQAHAADAAAAFERRAAETIADLERRIEGFDRQKRTIEQALAEATRVTDLVAAVDVHVATLTSPDRDLAHAQAAVDEIERRATAAATRLQHLARTSDDLELAITTTEQHLSTVKVAARGVVIRTATPYWPFVGGYAALVASALLAVFVLRNPGPPAGTLNDTRLAQRESAVAETSRPPAARTIAASPLPPPTVPAKPAGAPPRASLPSASTAPLSGIPSASAERRVPAASSSPSPAKPTPVRQAAAAPLPDATAAKRPATPAGHRGGPAARPARAVAATKKPGSQAASPQAVAATKDVKRFVGVLAVESVPVGAAVFINQQPVGQTPLNLPDVRAGTHAIRVEHDGYARWTAAVLVSAGKQTRVSTLLQPIGPGPGANSGR
jgi:DNA repair exonuclease SbcCD ATPase subunit